MLVRKRVLVADDQRSTRRGLKALLGIMPGVEWIGESVNGREAVNQVALDEPDVVLMDALMPVMDGIEATQYIKRQAPNVKVVMLSMYAEYESVALAAGVDIFLIKGGNTDAIRCAICSA